MKQARCSGAIRIPASPDAFAVPLVSDHQLIECGEVQLQLPAGPQLLDRADENQVGSTGTKTGRGRGGQGEEFSRFKVSGGLESDFGDVADGVFASGRHITDLLQNDSVQVVGARGRNRTCQSNEQSDSFSQHAVPKYGLTQGQVLRAGIQQGVCYVRFMLRFIKMNGAGNDFVMLNNLEGDIQLSRQQISSICDRHRGVGADGILLLEKAGNGTDFRMRYYNRDGGEAEMCGNGARCFARFANKVAGAESPIRFETPAGTIAAELQGEQVTLQMSEPTDLRLNVRLQLEGEDTTVHFVNTGVPHVVVPVSRVEMVPVRERGAAIRYHEMFAPRGTNANFLEARGRQSIIIRTYERGVEDETLACGTGVVASALIFAEMHRVPGPISVRVRGGSDLLVDFSKRDGRFRDVRLTGPADFVFEGAIDI